MWIVAFKCSGLCVGALGRFFPFFCGLGISMWSRGIGPVSGSVFGFTSYIHYTNELL
jgi:hypothetical protein